MRRQIQSIAGPVFYSLTVCFLFSGFAPVPAGAHALAISPDGHRLYVSAGIGAPDIDVIDTQASALLTRLPVRVPTGDRGFHAPLALSPDGSMLYAEGDLGSIALYAIDLATRKLTATVPVLNIGERSTGDLAVSPDGSRVYVLGGDVRTNLSVVSVVDAATNKILAVIPVFGFGEALSPDGKKLYVTGGYSGSAGPGVVSVVDTTTNRLTGTIAVQPFPGGIAAGPGGRRVYVTHNDFGSAAVDVINTFSDVLDTRSGFIPGGASLAPVVSPDGKRLYVLPLPWNMAAAVSLVHAGVLGTVGVGGSPIDQVISPGGDRLYVLTQSGSSGAGSITIVDTSTLAVVATIDLGKLPAEKP